MNDIVHEIKRLMYETSQEKIEVEAVVKDETLWLSQKSMAKLFWVNPQAITKHLGHIFEEWELIKEGVCSILEHTANDGKNYKVQFYNLDAIISVWYRINSFKATQFRIRATKILKEYMQKGFVLDDERLKNGEKTFWKDYFRELLDRIRSIRASERRIWQQITDIFAECSIDYDKTSPITQEFYATIQNKFHYAITGKTAAEIIYEKADSTQENMGLTTWKYAPNGRILKSDVVIAKNYLSEQEIKQLERNVAWYFDYIEDLISREQVFTMEEFSESVNAFLQFRKYKILEHKGKISHQEAEEKAVHEYEKFNKTQKIISDFDQLVEKMKEK